MNATDSFFHQLAERPDQPLLRRAQGTVRVELAATRSTPARQWLVHLDHGAVQARSDVDGQAADCVLRTSPAVFDRLASGRANAMAALLRRDITYDGDLSLLVFLQRLFPWPAAEAGRVTRKAQR
jgi:putative sterol carrier protein